MTGEDADAGVPSTFVEQMYWAVVEESRLFELPLGVTYHVARQQVVVGPWDPTDCSRQLLQWFDRGLIELYTSDEVVPRTPEEWRARWAGEHDHVLSAHAARRLLAETERWIVDSDDGLVCLRRTEVGMESTAPWE